VSALLIIGFSIGVPVIRGQEPEIARKLKSKVSPTYPDLAKKMAISGTVKVQITVDRNGTIKNSKLVGGHPILANAALEAVRKWKYEAAGEETTGIVEFRFDPEK
jgi:TonB family protein